MLDGILRCAGCGGKVYTHYQTQKGRRYAVYYCADRIKGKARCQEPSISARLADEAVLRQVARIKGVVWKEEQFEAAVHRDPNEAARMALRSEIARIDQQLVANVQMLRELGEVTAEAREAFKRDAHGLSLKQRHLKDQLQALPAVRIDPAKAKELHAVLARQDFADYIAAACQRHDTQTLREVVVATVHSARIVQRGNAGGTSGPATWALARCDWTPEVELLLEAGELTLEPDPAAPTPKTAKEQAAERARRYRQRQRQQQASQEESLTVLSSCP